MPLHRPLDEQAWGICTVQLQRPGNIEGFEEQITTYCVGYGPYPKRSGAYVGGRAGPEGRPKMRGKLLLLLLLLWPLSGGGRSCLERHSPVLLEHWKRSCSRGAREFVVHHGKVI
ncbi:hypothetical protein GGTG_02711 [Gaeumannomyces tritici R3-111a-1]|uniref:Uncharacterized protein n=1 Tax=Gaeumannomyces tritici (strain R3-111a-1) TaxID=644352 RepID=J3NN53_GAET3|nr:hypothetical protein GGTG_02711 [Gaeumannomyces tritici R3-111a-1]EJT77605.1 hypothetical protein GGTG_02711 [Gaeumannomyces tritici R3-111a-1]